MTHDCVTHFCIHDALAVGIAFAIAAWAVYTSIKDWTDALR